MILCFNVMAIHGHVCRFCSGLVQCNGLVEMRVQIGWSILQIHVEKNFGIRENPATHAQVAHQKGPDESVLVHSRQKHWAAELVERGFA
jgi:hypothetical protein